MARVNISDVKVLGNPADFHDPFKFEITFECFEPLPNDLEWKLTYVGSAESQDYDQILDTVLVGPVPEGKHKFVLEADPPNPAKIPTEELVGVTVILLSCAYNEKDFIQIGYFIRHEYTDDEELREDPPEKPIIEKLKRHVAVDEPRVTRFNIKWDSGADAGTGGEKNDDENRNQAAVDDSDEEKEQEKNQSAQNDQNLPRSTAGEIVEDNHRKPSNNKENVSSGKTVVESAATAASKPPSSEADEPPSKSRKVVGGNHPEVSGSGDTLSATIVP